MRLPKLMLSPPARAEEKTQRLGVLRERLRIFYERKEIEINRYME